MSCFKQGRRSRLFYSFLVYRGRKGEPKGFTWRDYRDLIVRAHIQLGGPIILVWDTTVRLMRRRPVLGPDPWDNWPWLPCSGSVGFRPRAVLAAAGPAGVSR
ncbi:hypothetical protein [Streptomyces sp. NPDC056480]|uniref:hypothetical protein n=1 Tax=Streptomyces sp. NPDC056480 TaxID=3345833 RepID=UPI0036B65873